MKKSLLTCFGLGSMPFAPGTWGSVPAAVLFGVLAMCISQPLVIAVVMAVVVVVASVVCIKFAPEQIAKTGNDDPSFVVADEVAGQGVVFLIISLAGVQISTIWIAAAAGFVLFRVFDIFKPWPCKRLEKLHGGVGILADDLMAGVYAGLLLLVFCTIKAHHTQVTQGHELTGLTAGFAVLLGAAQGLTEFLPVSSSGHLVFLEHFIPTVDPESAEMLLFDLAVHVGTVGAILIVFWKRISAFVVNLFKTGGYGSNPVDIFKRSPSVRFCVLAMVTTLITVILYKVFKEPLESARRLDVLAVTWAITGTVLILTDMRKQSRRSLRKFGLTCAIIVGIAQSCAILPGISRSGATICAAILLGLHRQWAIDFSFLISIPAILGGALLMFLDNQALLTSGDLPIGSVLIGMVTSMLVGIVSLQILIKASRQRKLKYFAIYCYILSVFVFVYLL